MVKGVFMLDWKNESYHDTQFPRINLNVGAVRIALGLARWYVHFQSLGGGTKDLRDV